MADPISTAAASATKVETAVTSEVAKLIADFKAEVVTVKAEVVTLKARTFHLGTVALIAAGAFVLGLLVHLL